MPTAPGTLGSGRLLAEEFTRGDHEFISERRGHEPVVHSVPTDRLVHGARVARFFGGTLAVFTLTFGMGLALLSFGPALALDWKPVVITSGSMQPTIRPGDIVLARSTDDLSLGSGSIVVFDDPQRDGLVTHRVVEVHDDGSLVTKGDANQSRDAVPVDPDRVVGAGRLVVPLVGEPVNWVRQGAWSELVVFATGVLACLYATRFGLDARYDPWAGT